ncbi:hypothetical protein Dimus_034279 [Dionaea muscipula]
MPLYDCMLLLKPNLKKELLIDLVARVGRHVLARNGVLTEIKSLGTVQLGYGIKKLDGRYFQGQLTQITMMATPNINKELHYLNKEDRLLRWIVVKHRDVQFGLDYADRMGDMGGLGRGFFNVDADDDRSLRRGFFNVDADDDDGDDRGLRRGFFNVDRDREEEEDYDEYEVEEENKEGPEQ